MPARVAEVALEHLVEMRLDVAPAPQQRLPLHRVDVDEVLVAKQTRAIGPEVDVLGQVAGAGARLGRILGPLHFLDQLGLAIDVVNFEPLEQRGVAEGQPHEQVVAIVAIAIWRHRGRVPHIEAAYAVGVGADHRNAFAAYAHVDHRRVPRDGQRLLARLQHLDGGIDAGCQGRRGPGVGRVRDGGGTAPRLRLRHRSQTLDLGIDGRARHDDRRPMMLLAGGLGADIDEIELAHLNLLARFFRPRH